MEWLANCNLERTTGEVLQIQVIGRADHYIKVVEVTQCRW